ncbi:hypothetical protein ACWDKQ_30875 [Saccharopolyspora sp. NPDC000995]
MTAAAEPVSASTEPTERSISPAIRATVRPQARIVSVDAASRTLRTFPTVAKSGAMADKTQQTAINAMEVPAIGDATTRNQTGRRF